MGLTAEQLKQRKTGIGSSDAPAVLGLDPFRSPIDVYAEKTGERAPFAGNEHTELGDALEAPLAGLAARRLGVVAAKNSRTWAHPVRPYALATPDYILGRERLLEVKATVLGAHWGPEEEGRTALPERVDCQVQWQLGVTGYRLADVAALVQGELRIYRGIEFDLDFFAHALELCGRFMRDHVEARVPPPPDGSDRYSAWLKEKFPQDKGAIVDSTPLLDQDVRAYQQARAKLKTVEAEVDLYEARIKAAINVNSGLKGPWGLITWKTAKGSRKVDWEAVASAVNAPADVIERCTRTTVGSRRFLSRFDQE